VRTQKAQGSKLKAQSEAFGCLRLGVGGKIGITSIFSLNQQIIELTNQPDQIQP
jgi:hypothetical protein